LDSRGVLMRVLLAATCLGSSLFTPLLSPQQQVATQAVSVPMPMYQPEAYRYAAPAPPVSATGPSYAAGLCALLGGVAVARVATLRVSGKDSVSDVLKAGLAALLAFGSVTAASAGPFTRSEIASLTYEQVKGTGLANTCPLVEGTKGDKGVNSVIELNNGKKYRIEEFCMEPTSFQVLEEKMTREGLVTQAVDTKVTTRQTYTLTGIDGDLKVDGGKLSFQEKDGIDYAASTVQMPGGERVPFLFTVKNLLAQSDVATNKIEPGLTMSGPFTVPSYRTGLFLDPKGRGTTTGYDQAVALPAMQAGGDEAMFKENNKKFDVLKGNVSLKMTSVNAELGEFGGCSSRSSPLTPISGRRSPENCC